MAKSSDNLRERLVEYAWEAWSALGVAGWRARSFAAAVDVDALVLLTGRLGDEDARLRDESIDWIVANLALVSRSRLAHLLRDGPGEPGWAAYAGTLQRATRQRWPDAGTPFAWKPSGKSRLPERANGATFGLRCRALFGATARGEVVRALVLAGDDREFDARDLAVEAAYTKRAIAEALEHLRAGGLVTSTAVGNSLRFRLARRTELEALLEPLPADRRSQRALLRVGWSISRAEDATAQASERVRLVEGARLARELEADIRSLDPAGARLTAGPATLEALREWASEMVAAPRAETTGARSARRRRA